MSSRIISVDTAKSDFGVDLPNPVEVTSEHELTIQAVREALLSYSRVKAIESEIRAGKTHPNDVQTLQIALQALRSSEIQVKSAKGA